MAAPLPAIYYYPDRRNFALRFKNEALASWYQGRNTEGRVSDRHRRRVYIPLPEGLIYIRSGSRGMVVGFDHPENAEAWCQKIIFWQVDERNSTEALPVTVMPPDAPTVDQTSDTNSSRLGTTSFNQSSTTVINSPNIANHDVKTSQTKISTQPTNSGTRVRGEIKRPETPLKVPATSRGRPTGEGADGTDPTHATSRRKRRDSPRGRSHSIRGRSRSSKRSTSSNRNEGKKKEEKAQLRSPGITDSEMSDMLEFTVIENTRTRNGAEGSSSSAVEFISTKVEKFMKRLTKEKDR